MPDTPTLVKFYMGWVEDGAGPDGLPLFRQQLKIVKSRPPLLRLDLEATEADIEDFPGPYALFQKEEAARKTTPAEGYPLVLWPACGEMHLKMLAARDIVTVEQLAKLAGRGQDEGMPADVKELADRAAKMVELQKNVGKFEKLIRDKDGQLAALQEQVDEAVKTIAAQKTVIDRLRVSTAV
jgi:hypothetical protein